MKIKEVQAGIKIIKDYNSYQASLVAEVGENENPEEVGSLLMEKSFSIVFDKIDEKKEIIEDLEQQRKLKKLGRKKFFEKEKNIFDNEIEVGAAWFDKEDETKLSVKDSETGNWREIKISDLKEIDEGYLEKTPKGIFIFKKIPDEKRINQKMPFFRIYKKINEI